jgi:hypothetical protein
LIYYPSIELTHTWTWTRLGLCVWEGPEWFTLSPILQARKEYQQLASLFCFTLGLKKVDLADLLLFLSHIKEKKLYVTDKEEEAKIKKIYQELYLLPIDPLDELR